MRSLERGLEAVQRFTGVEGEEDEDLDIDTVISMMVKQQLQSVIGAYRGSRLLRSRVHTPTRLQEELAAWVGFLSSPIEVAWGRIDDVLCADSDAEGERAAGWGGVEACSATGGARGAAGAGGGEHPSHVQGAASARGRRSSRRDTVLG
jgi:hypothetical protein